MPVEIINRNVGKLFPTIHVHQAAYLRAAGHKIHAYQIDPDTGKLVFQFQSTDPETGRTVHDTIRDYNNHDLKVDAMTIIETWMELRNATRNKGFAVGQKEKD